jgi:hypothetical protein
MDVGAGYRLKRNTCCAPPLNNDEKIINFSHCEISFQLKGIKPEFGEIFLQAGSAQRYAKRDMAGSWSAWSLQALPATSSR